MTFDAQRLLCGRFEIDEANLLVERPISDRVAAVQVDDSVRIALLFEQEHVVGTAEDVPFLHDHVAGREP